MGQLGHGLGETTGGAALGVTDPFPNRSSYNRGHLISQQYVVLRWTNAEIPERQTHRWVTQWAVSLQCLQWAAADLHGAREGEPQACPEPM